MANRDYQLQIMKHQTEWASSSSPEVEFTFDTLNGELADIPKRVGGQTVRPLEGQVEALSFSVRVLDKNESFTGILSDSDGRPDIIRRVARWRRSSDGGTNWTTVATGRISEVRLSSSVMSYEVTISDEMWLMRNTEFPKIGENEPYSATTSLYPGGTRSGWNRSKPVVVGLAEVKNIDGNLVHILPLIREGPGVDRQVIGATADLISEDLKDDARPNASISGQSGTTTGDFKHLRADITDAGSAGTSGEGKKEVMARGLMFDGRVGKEVKDTFLEKKVRRITDLVLVWPSNQPSEGDLVRFYLQMPEGEIKDNHPLHFGGYTPVDDTDGGESGSSSLGLHPVQFAKNAIQNENLLIDEASFDSLIKQQDIGRITPRITEQTNLFDVLQQKVFKPFGVIPYVNEAGEIAIKSYLNPTHEVINDPDTLTKLDSTGISGKEHPSFTILGDEQVTLIESKKSKVFWMAPIQVMEEFLDTKIPHNADILTTDQAWAISDWGEKTINSDGILIEERDLDPVKSNRVDKYGERKHEVLFPVFIPFQEEKHKEALFQRIFDRYQDGAIRTSVRGLRETQSYEMSEYIRLDLESYPNLNTGTRGGERIMQVVSIKETPIGTELELLDAGPNLQPLPTPTLSASSAGDYSIDVTVGGSGGTGTALEGDHAIIQLAADDGASAPAQDSDKWITVQKVSSQGTYTIQSLSPGQKYWVRARQNADKRIASDWSTADSATTTSPTGPSNLVIADDLGCAVTLSWTVGEDDLFTQVLLDGNEEKMVSPGTSRATIENLELDTSYTYEVRHIGPFGGTIGSSTVTDTTNASSSTGPEAGPMFVLIGKV